MPREQVGQPEWTWGTLLKGKPLPPTRSLVQDLHSVVGERKLWEDAATPPISCSSCETTVWATFALCLSLLLFRAPGSAVRN